MRPPEFVGHLDADAFYVSAERVRNGFLAEKPVGVLGNQGACIIAKSYEMKYTGVGTGMPIWEALVKCPTGIYVKRDFRWYEVLSHMMLECVRDLSPQVEYYSIDEFFFVAPEIRGQTFQQMAEGIRDTILKRVRVPVTVGIARTRTLAKLISDSAKPFGARAVLDQEQEEELLASLPVTDITGIAGRRARRLEPWGIRTCLDFARADRRLIRELLNSTGEALWWELRGEPVNPIHPERPRHKTLSRGGSFGEATDNPSMLYAWLVRNLERLIEELEYHELKTGNLSVAVEYKNGDKREGRKGLAIPSERFDMLLDVARPCLRSAWLPDVPASRMHLFAHSLVAKGQSQLGFFAGDSVKAEAIARLKRAVNEKHGRFILRSGATLPLEHIYRDKANEFDICDVRGKICF